MTHFKVIVSRQERAESQGITGKSTYAASKVINALFLQDIAANYLEAERITPVMDSLNTHPLGSLYEVFAPSRPWRCGRVLSSFTTPSAAAG